VSVDTLLEAGARVEAQDDGSSRWYNHPVTGERYLSVTWVTGATTSKPWLGAWSAKMAAEYAVDFAARWQATQRTEGRDAAVKQIKKIAAANRDLKAEVGRYEHDVIEAMFLDHPIPGIPDHLDGQVVEVDDELIVIDQAWLDSLADGFLNFVADFDISAVAAECTVASDKAKGAGTIDGLVRSAFFRGELIGMDTKTGKHLGPEVLAQLGPYDRFEFIWLRSGAIVRKPPVDRWAILHLRSSYARGYKLIFVTADELQQGWEWWLKCRAQVAAAEAVPKRFGHVLYPPLPDGTQPPPMLEDLTSYPGCSRAVKPLVEAGFTWLADVAVLHRADVREIKGVGPKTVDALAAVLAECGLAFAGEQAPEQVPAQRKAVA
jgi:hypothetical protein